MAIKLVRESSNIPNVANVDDVRMIRYAYGGYSGVVKGYGQELSGTTDGAVFTIGSGRVVVQGWEVDIDGAGVSLDFSSFSSGIIYITVYLEVNASLETATVKYIYDSSDYPSISEGDDLTEAPYGTARIPLYKVLRSSSFYITPQFSIIPYATDDEYVCGKARLLSLKRNLVTDRTLPFSGAGFYIIEWARPDSPHEIKSCLAYIESIVTASYFSPYIFDSYLESGNIRYHTVSVGYNGRISIEQIDYSQDGVYVSGADVTVAFDIHVTKIGEVS